MGKHKRNKSAKGQWNEPTGYNVHHRLPKSRGGRNDPINYSTVPIRLHHYFNELFGSNPTAEEVALVLTNIWIDPSYIIICKLRDYSE
jgi:hypothetical protein